MANASNKHKAQGKKPVVKKESWWTPQRVKIAITAGIVLILVLIGIGIANYVSGLQDSIVGKWSYVYAADDTGEKMEVVLEFNDDKTCGFTRTREGVEETSMDGVYDIDDHYDIVSLMLGSDYSTVMQYYYDCDDDQLVMTNFTTGEVCDYTKIAE